MCHRRSQMRHDKDTETEGRQKARQDKRPSFSLTHKEMMKPPKLCPTKVCVFHSRLCLVETAPREPTSQTTLALGGWACGFLQERAQEPTMSKQNLLGILAHLHRWASVWLTLTRPKLKRTMMTATDPFELCLNCVRRKSQTHKPHTAKRRSSCPDALSFRD